VPNTEPHRYGGVLVDSKGVVTGFSRRGSGEPSCHFIGLQAADAEAFLSIPDNTPCESTRSLYPALMRDAPGSVRAWRTTASFLDIGTPADYLKTALQLAAHEGVDLKAAAARPRIDPTARVIDSILWDDVEVGKGTALRECIVTDGVSVPADTSWTGVMLRRPSGELCDGERVIDGLVISSV
jgi:NDP-sugar pyrophosphorylase family protein